MSKNTPKTTIPIKKPNPDNTLKQPPQTPDKKSDFDNNGRPNSPL